VRKLIALGVVVVVLLVDGAIADVVVRHRVQDLVAQQIDAQVPGAHATVSISSFPFLGHLAVSGDVPRLTAQVTGVEAGPVALDSVDVVVTDLDIDRGELVQGRIELRSIKEVSVTATISQATLDAQIGLPVTLGQGTVGLAGIQARASLTVTGQQVEIQVPPLPAVTLDVPATSLLPCLGSAQLDPGVLTVSCTTTRIPPVLQGISGSL
jgi:hypothetical protein